MRLRLLFPPAKVWMMLALLAFLLFIEGKSSTKVASQHSGPLPTETVAEPNAVSAFRVPESRDYDARLTLLADRPLFSHTRRNPSSVEVLVAEPVERETELEAPEVAADPAPQVPTPPALEFRGYMRDGAHIRVLLAMPASSEEWWVAIGDRIQEWNVANVSETMVRLAQGEFEHVVEKP